VRKVLLPLVAAVWFAMIDASHSVAQWRLYEETFIAGSIGGIIAPGYVFRTVSGNEYALNEAYFDLARYAGQRALVLHDGRSYKLLVQGVGESLRCRKLTPGGILASLPLGPDAVISRIEGEFAGYGEGKEFVLLNGQVWEQLSPESESVLRTRPEAFVIPRERGYVLWVQGTRDFVEVRRVR
jgi:hypothetical protein